MRLNKICTNILYNNLKPGDVLAGICKYTIEEIKKDRVKVVYDNNCRGSIEKKEIGNNGQWFKLVRQ